MKITGLTILRNGVKNNYPFKESILSALPLVDEMIVCIGNSQDNTRDVLLSIQDPKIKIIDTVWDTSNIKGGSILADETNKGLEFIGDDADWILYLQADELIHEKDIPIFRKSAENYFSDTSIDGFLSPYLHFYGDYQHTAYGRKWYRYEVRFIRNDKGIRSYKDAQGFRKNGKRLNVVKIGAPVYHYGWVKWPDQMKNKLIEASQYWSANPNDPYVRGAQQFAGFTSEELVRPFTGTHPSVMKELIYNFEFQFDYDKSKLKLSFKHKFLNWIEAATGNRLFEFRNWRIIK